MIIIGGAVAVSIPIGFSHQLRQSIEYTYPTPYYVSIPIGFLIS